MVIYMSGSQNLRIVVFCLGFETVKVLKPLEYYKADRAYMLCMTKAPGYKAFKKEIERQMKGKAIEFLAIETTVYKFSDCLKELYKILHMEKEAGNHVYVNIFGTPAYSAAAMVACMMEDAVPFFAGTKEYTIPDPKEYYVKGRPMGISREDYDPMELPIFHLDPPRVDVIKGLRLWKKRVEKGWVLTDTAIIEDLEKNGLMKKVHDNRGRVTQNAKMQYRRRFLEKWLSEKWVEPIERGKYELTDYGKVVVEVF
jgi:hypothetical protein